MTANMQASLDLILAKLEIIESAVLSQSGKVAKTSAEAVLREKLDHLTLKRHAVLTATLGGVSYQEIAKIMQCSETTIKLHLKSALQLLDISSREVLLSSHKRILETIPDKEYKLRYGISRRWWIEDDPALIEVLSSTKPAANQHTKKE